MIYDMLKKRNLPAFLSKSKMLDLILNEEYGYMPPKPDDISWIVEKNQIPNFCAGKAVCNKVNIKIKLNNLNDIIHSKNEKKEASEVQNLMSQLSIKDQNDRNFIKKNR